MKLTRPLLLAFISFFSAYCFGQYAGPPQEICQTTGTVTMAATGSGTWVALSTNPVTTTITSPTSPTTTITGLSTAGIYRYVWAPGDTEVVTVDATPATPLVSPSVDTLCLGQSVNLIGHSGTNSINWWTASTGGTLLGTTASGANFNVSPTASTTYYAEGALPQSATYNFGTCGVTDTMGPNQAQADASYLGSNLQGAVTIVGNGIQQWTVPSTGNYTFTVNGASGGLSVNAGFGAQVQGTVYLTAGTILELLVGQMGSSFAPTYSDGGGGGSFVVSSSGVIYFVAGGGGGGAQNQAPGSAQNASPDSTVVSSAAQQFGSAGAGYSMDGTNFSYGTYTPVAQSFLNGGEGQSGGQAGGWPGIGYGDGGFGGGASSCSCSQGGGGGGGGYLGGGGGSYTAGYNSGYGGSSYINSLASATSSSVLGGPGDGSITVVFAGSSPCVSNSRTPVPVVVNSVPGGVVVSPSDSSQCGGTVTITASGGSGGTIYWQDTLSLSSLLTTASVSQTVSASGIYYFAAYNGRCWGTHDSAVIAINYVPDTPTVVAAPANLCAGQTSILTGTATGSNINWWTARTGGTLLTTTTSGAPYPVTPSATTTYYAQAQVPSANGADTFIYTGATQMWTVPIGVTSITVDASGAQGGNETTYGDQGGMGARVQTTISVSPGQTLYINVGGQGQSETSSGGTSGSGGWNGGGNGGTGNCCGGGGGGGATDIRIGGTAWSNIVVDAGGGGGAGGFGTAGGAGSGGAGGQNGVAGQNGATTATGGGGGTSAASGAGGLAGTGSNAGVAGVLNVGGDGGHGSNNGGGGGGGGYYGGGGGGGNAAGDHSAGGGGGSSYSSGSSTTYTTGYRSGNGIVYITYSPTTGCPSVGRSAVTVTVSGTPPGSISISSSAPTATCGGYVVLTASGGSGGTIYWEDTSAIAYSTSHPSSIDTVYSTGIYYFNAFNGSCWSGHDSALVVINYLPPPPPATAVPDSICIGQTSNLSAVSPGTNINWWNASTGGTLLTTLASGANYSVTPAATTTYYADAQVPSSSGMDTFLYTGSYQAWTVPAGVTTINVDARGAAGGADYVSVAGGDGARVQTTLSVLPGQQLYFFVGGAGAAGTSAPGGGTGGYNGGGSGATGGCCHGGGGGGASDIRLNDTLLAHRIVVAGGGGGAGGYASTGSGQGGAAGQLGTAGFNGTTSGGGGGGGASSGGAGGAAGTSSGLNVAGTSGVLGSGGIGGYGTSNGGGGGGGGYYGGGGGGGDIGGDHAGGGGGGSSYSSGSATTYTSGYQTGNGVIYLSFTPTTGCVSVSRTPVTVTVYPTAPGAVAVTPALTTQCGGNVTLTATGGSGGTIYWEDTVSGGMSRAVPGTSHTVSASGYYYFAAYNGHCWGSQDSALVVINTVPASPNTVVASPAAICTGSSLISANVGPGLQVNWWSADTGGTLLATLPSAGTYSVSPSVSTVYYAEAQALADTVVDTITVSGTWIVPANVNSITVYAWGGGGGAGGSYLDGPDFDNSGGGGGAACSAGNTMTVSPGQTYTITIGAGGAGGYFVGTTPTAGGNGGWTYFSGPAGVVSASGGLGSPGAVSTSGYTNPAGTGGDSGTTVGAGIVYFGADGSAGINGTSSTNGFTGTGGGSGGSSGSAIAPTSLCGVTAPGGGGTYPGGSGGYNTYCGTTTNFGGFPGTAPGGGGSGINDWSSSEMGGAGANGWVIVTYAVNTCPSVRVPDTVFVGPPATVSVTPATATQCGGSVTLTAHESTTGSVVYWQNTTSGGTSTSTPSTSQTVNSSGTYYFNAYLGCWGQQDSAVVVINPIPATPALIEKGSCPWPDTLVVHAGGANDISILKNGSAWQGTTTGDSVYLVSSVGSYSAYVTGVGGCLSANSDSVTVANCQPDTIWPGDADNNKVVNNTDLLPIGLAYDSTGYSRTVQGNVWQGDLDYPWAHNFSLYAPTVNFNYADCNGDGIVNANDTLAIMQNYGLTHHNLGIQQPWRSGIPALYMTMSLDTAYNTNVLSTSVYLGTAAIPANNIYGLAFTFNFDPSVLDSSTASFGFLGTSWVGSPTNSINLHKDFWGPGNIQAAITGIDHSNRSGNGQIAQFNTIVSIANINWGGKNIYTNHVSISNVTAVDELGNIIQLNDGIDSDYIVKPLGVNSIDATPVVHLFPNPANNSVIVTSNVTIASVSITDILGKEVLIALIDNKNSEKLNIAGLAAGIYTVKIISSLGSTTSDKLVIEK